MPSKVNWEDIETTGAKGQEGVSASKVVLEVGGRNRGLGE